MIGSMALVVGILGVAIVLFVTEKIRVDLVALLVLAALAISGLVTPAEALSGFSNPAVVTVWAVLILSGALSKTGVANLIGKRLLQWGGGGESRLMFLIMLIAGILSGFMNSIGVASLLMPVVIDIARHTKRSPSKMLIPLAYAALLGGLVTLIGTPPNILISEALRDAGLEPFGMFDFTPIGIVIMIVGVIFLAVAGRFLLPDRDIAREYINPDATNSLELFGLQERMAVIQIPADSPFCGKSLKTSRLGLALGLNVVAILRQDQPQLAPSPETIIHPGDRLLVEGRLGHLDDMDDSQHFVLEDANLAIDRLTSEDINLFDIQLGAQTEFLNKTLSEIDLRRKYGVIVLAIRRSEQVWRTNLEKIRLQEGDILLTQGTQEQIDKLLSNDSDLTTSTVRAEDYHLEERLMLLRVLPDSELDGKSLTESRLGFAYGLGVMGILRQGELLLMIAPDECIEANDLLIVKGRKEDLETVQGIKHLKVEKQAPLDIADLRSEAIGLEQAVLSPFTALVGKSLQDLHFRAKYGLNVLAIWREGRAYRSNLRDMALKFGDALLLYGPREKLRLLGSDPDFLVLTQEVQEPARTKKAPLAIAIMVGVLIPVIFGWLHIAIAAIAGVILMVLTNCLSMDEAYRAIEWKAIFLIAGMLPLGIAMERTGTAQFLAEGMVALIGDLGPLAIMTGLFILASLASQVMPNPAVAVLLAPIALSTAADMGISPYPLMMTLAISASAAFLSPVGHPANVLVMGPGGYKFSDYIKIGLPLTVLVLLVVLIVLPWIMPL